MRKDLLAYVALGAVCIIWGTTYLALRIAVVHFPPFLFVAIRQTIAGALLAGAMLLFGKATWPSKADIVRHMIAGFFMISIGNGLVAWAEMHIPSGIAAIICSLMPMMVILINMTVNRNEKPTVPIMIGVLVGLSGIMMIFGEHISEFGNTAYLTGIILVFLSIISWAAGSVWIKRGSMPSNPVLNAGFQLFFGGLWLFPVSLVTDNLTAITWSNEVVYAMIYLILFGSITAFTCYSYVLKKLPMTIVSLYAYINPIVAVVLGWLVLDETLNLKIGIAILITIAGIYIVNKGYQLRNLWKTTFSAGR